MSNKAHIKQNLVVITILCLALELSPPAYAGTVWDGGGGNTNINTATNWDDNVNPAFNGTQAMTIGTGGTNATINTNVSFMGLTFNRDNNFTVAAGAGNLTIGDGGINAAIPNTTPRTYTISEGVILGADQTWTATNNGSGTTTLTVSGGVSGVGRNLTLGGTGSIGISGLIGIGTGALTKTGTGALTLTRANTYTGGTTLASGTLLVGNNAALGTGTLGLNGGTLASSSATARTLTNSSVIGGDFTLGQTSGGTGTLTLSGAMDLGGAMRQITVNNAADTISGVISGTGGVTKAGTGALTLSGANTYTGGTTVSAGSLQGNSTSLQGAITNNATVTFNQTAAGTYTGNMSGTGALTKTGTGALTLSGANTYTGTTTIDAGTLSVNGSILSPVTINTAGTLAGTGTIVGDVTNAGIIAPGSLETMTITGNYTHNAGAVYRVEANSAGASDRLVVSGTATLSGGAVYVLADSGTYATMTNYTILTAGSVIGTFASVASNLAFLTPSLNYDPTNVYLALTKNSTSYTDIASTPNQYAVASALTDAASGATGDMATVITNLNSLSAAGARDAFDQMGGLFHTALTGAAFSSLSRYMDALSTRMWGFTTGGSQTSFQGPMFASRTDIATDAGNAFLTGMGRTNEQPRRGLWMRGYGDLGERRGNDISSRYDYNIAGIAAGFDKKVSDTFLLGFSTAYSQTKVDMKDLSENGRSASYQGSLYGSYKSGPWYVEGIAAYGYNRYDTSRDISFGEIKRTANADYSGNAFGAYTEAGYRIKVNTMNIIPMIAFQASYLTRKSFTEKDAGALNLDVDRDQASSLLGSLGVKLKKDFAIDAVTLTPELRVKWLHEFSGDDYMLNASFAGSPTSAFTVRGDKPNRDSVALGFGLSCVTKKNLSLSLAYGANISGDFTEHAGLLGIKYRW